MKTTHVMRALVVNLALEWELCRQDPFIFCYRIGVEPVRIFFGRFDSPSVTGIHDRIARANSLIFCSMLRA